MYHYSQETRTSAGFLWREPEDIREELSSIRLLLSDAERRMEAAERAKEDILEALGDATPTPEQIQTLERAVEECATQKTRLEELWDRTDSLGEELADSLFLFHGIPYGR